MLDDDGLYDTSTYALEGRQVGGVECTGEAVGRRTETLHEEGDTESIEAQADKVLQH